MGGEKRIFVRNNKGKVKCRSFRILRIKCESEEDCETEVMTIKQRRNAHFLTQGKKGKVK